MMACTHLVAFRLSVPSHLTRGAASPSPSGLVLLLQMFKEGKPVWSPKQELPVGSPVRVDAR